MNKDDKKGLDNARLDIVSKLHELEASTSARTVELNGNLGSDCTKKVIEFVDLASGSNSTEHYKYFPDSAIFILQNIQREYGDAATKSFLCLAIFHAMNLTIKKRLLDQLPKTLSINQIQHFKRMLSDTDIGDSWLDIDQDLYQKEFGLASERLFAAGSQLLDKNCGIPRSIVLKGGFVKSITNGLFFAGIGGFKPFIQIHTHSFNLNKFNQAGWDECYVGCAELCEIFPELLGVFGSSWFYDPVICNISPRLQYLQSVPLAGGAKFLYYSTGGAAIANATSTSESRKKMYDAGEYIPKNYMMIWSKKSLKSLAN
jgi:hypothetical protein